MLGYLGFEDHKETIKEITYLNIAWNYALKNSLRKLDIADEIKPFLSDLDFKEVMSHQNDMRSVSALVDWFIGTDYDKIRAIANNLADLLELLEYFRQQQANNLTDANFVHDQTVLATVWTINHNMAKFPSVGLIDQNGELMGGIVDHVDNNNLTVTFSVPVMGTATLN